MSEEIKIEKGIKRPRMFKYPLHEMKVGDSFLITDAKKAVFLRGYKFSVFTVKEGCRCWRIK